MGFIERLLLKRLRRELEKEFERCKELLVGKYNELIERLNKHVNHCVRAVATLRGEVEEIKEKVDKIRFELNSLTRAASEYNRFFSSPYAVMKLCSMIACEHFKSAEHVLRERLSKNVWVGFRECLVDYGNGIPVEEDAVMIPCIAFYDNKDPCEVKLGSQHGVHGVFVKPSGYDWVPLIFARRDYRPLLYCPGSVVKIDPPPKKVAFIKFEPIGKTITDF